MSNDPLYTTLLEQRLFEEVACGAWRRRRLPHHEPWHPADTLTEAMEEADAR